MNTLKDRINWAMSRPLTQGEAARTPAGLARACGIAAASVSNWMTGETQSIKVDNARKAAEYLGVNRDWLAEGIGARLPDASTQEPNVNEVTSRAKVPVISWVAAGLLGDVQDNYHPGEADEWVDVYGIKPGKNAFALRVDGDSMTSPYPNDFTFPHGTIIVVDPMRGADAGHFVVAKDVATQKATFKKLTTDGGRWFLKPLNPTYPTVEIDDPALRVIGRVVESMTRQKL